MPAQPTGVQLGRRAGSAILKRRRASVTEAGCDPAALIALPASKRVAGATGSSVLKRVFGRQHRAAPNGQWLYTSQPKPPADPGTAAVRACNRERAAACVLQRRWRSRAAVRARLAAVMQAAARRQHGRRVGAQRRKLAERRRRVAFELLATEITYHESLRCIESQVGNRDHIPREPSLHLSPV